MEETDSYSYPGAISSGAFKADAIQSYSPRLQKRSFEELYNHALFLQYLKHLYKQQARSQPKRVKPLVPRFEETHKKIRSDTAANEEVIVNHINPVNNFVELQGLGSICGSYTSNNALKSKVIKVIPETQPRAELPVIDLGKIQFPMSVKQEEISLTVKLEEGSEVKTESTSEGSASPEGLLHSPTQTVSSENLDKKDLKKYEKFMELYEEYKGKLNLNDQHVDEKFKQLTILVIPNLISHFKSKPFEAIAAAIVLYACREVDHPITLKQIVSISNSKEKLINKCIFSLKEIVPSNVEVKRFKAGEFIKMLSDKVNLNEHVRSAATKICENIERLNFMKSIHAVTLAACCLKFACDLSENYRDYEDLASAAGITKMTLKNMYRELFPYRLYFITADCMLNDPQELKLL